MKKHTDPIDWSFWQHMPALLWQACALSLNINPDNIKHHPQSWMNGPGRAPIFTEDSFPSEAVKTTFDRRLRLLGEHYQSQIFTDIDNSNAGDSHFAKVTIQNFAKWGLDVNFKDMPPELIAMAQQHNKGKVRDDGLVRLDALLLEISTELIAENPAVPPNSLKATIASAFEAHCGQPLEHVQAMVDRGEITLLDVLSRIPPPSPPKIEHTSDWLLSETDAQKIRTKLQSLADGATPAAPAESKPESKAETESQFAPAILDGEPRLQKGKNTRAKVDAWVKWTAKQKVMPGDTGVKLAERIQLEAKKWGYLSDRTKEDEHISVASIVKMLPPKVTGGHEKKRRKLNK